MHKRNLYQNINIQCPMAILQLGAALLLLAFSLSLIAYYCHYSFLRFISFALLVTSVLSFFFAWASDLAQIKFPKIGYLISGLMFFFYFILRTELLRFDFFIADASDYYLSGINAVVNKNDMGFFLPLTASLSATGFEVLGYNYAPFIITLIYSISLPLSYFIVKFLTNSKAISIWISLLILISPLTIWFPKSTYSESIWQIQLLVILLLLYIRIKNQRLNILFLFSIFASLLLLPFTRGEASLMYAIIGFFSLYFLWKHNHLKHAILVACSLIFLNIGIYMTLVLREHYLLKWQYQRIIPDITAIQLLSILFGALLFLLFLLIILYKNIERYRKINIYAATTIIALLFKGYVAYYYAKKSNPLFHSFDFLNEYEFALNNFGLPITVLIIAGLVLLYYKAAKGNIYALILVIFYAVFYLPFAMQAVRFEDVHEIFLYWNRYYFSILMMIHLYALGIAFHFIYSKLFKPAENKLHLTLLFNGFVFVLFWVSLNKNLILLTIKEGYLNNSYKLTPWLKNHVGSQPLRVVYDKTIKYDLHHNRSYDMRILTYRTFPTANIHVRKYLGVSPQDLNTSTNMDTNITGVNFLLCLSRHNCKLNQRDFTFIDSMRLPIEWRENYGVHPQKDIATHHNDITKSVTHQLTLYATLYAIKEKFAINKKIIFKKTSPLSSEILGKNWILSQNAIGAWSTKESMALYLPFFQPRKGYRYSVEIHFFVFGASASHPKNIIFSINGKVLKQLSLVRSGMKKVAIEIPDTLLPSKNKKLTILIKNNGHASSSKKKFTFYMKSLTIKESN